MLPTCLVVLTILAAGCSSPIEMTYSERALLLQSDSDAKQTQLNYRLGKDVIPTRYDILLKPYFVNESSNVEFTFDGFVKILIEAEKPGVTSIKLHAHRLNIKSSKVYANNNASVNLILGSVQYENETQLLTLSLSKELVQGLDYFIEFEYTGTMDEDMQGFYRSYYNEDGVKKWLGTTQFEQTHARRLMPCFDEPSFKAKFHLKVDRPKTFQPTLSNTKILTSSTVLDRIRDEFKDTPKMSPYLLAFIVSEYTGRKNALGSIGVYAPQERYNQTEYSFQFTEKVLSEYNNFTGYSYLSVPEVEKLDQAAIPDFEAGAMENWGLLTDTAILYDPKHSAARDKQRIATVVSHEIAHQWFGDLVTCEWWDVTWLNEGFARFFEYFGTHWVENTWELDLQFPVDQIQSVFQGDALESTHPMTSAVITPAEASAIFDSISYNKGGSVIRMMEHLIGPDVFRAAIKDYLSKNQFLAVRPEKLWTAIQNHVDENLLIAKIMDPWTTQRGYPYIYVTVKKDALEITQKRFLIKNPTHNDSTTWPIPITFATKSSDFASTKSLAAHIYYKEDGPKKTIKLASAPTGYVIVNNQQTGYYRVNYDTENWKKIKETLKSKQATDIHVTNRAQIVDDLFNLARAGLVDYYFALDIIDYMQDEKAYTPWVATFSGLTFLSRRLTTEDDAILLRSYVLGLLKNIYEHLGYYPKSGEKHTDILNRVNVLTWLCRYGHEDCLKNTRQEWSTFVAQVDLYDKYPDHRKLVYCTGLREGNSTHFDMLWRRYETTSVAHEQIAVLNALGCTKNSTLINKYLDTILTDKIRYQDKSTAFAAILSGNAENVPVIQEYLEKNFVQWSKKFGFNGMRDVASALTKVADRLTSKEALKKLKLFVENNKQQLGESTAKSVESAINETEWQMEWTNRNGPLIRTFWNFKKNSAPTTVFSSLLILLSVVSFYLVH